MFVEWQSHCKKTCKLNSLTIEYKTLITILFQSYEIPRAREVKQTWISSFFYTIYAFLVSIPLIIKIKPNIVLVNGPGTCLPVILATWCCCFIRIIPKAKIVYVESICRVKTLSLTAKMSWYFVDSIIVQWPEMALNYKGTTYIGKFSWNIWIYEWFIYSILIGRFHESRYPKLSNLRQLVVWTFPANSHGHYGLWTSYGLSCWDWECSIYEMKSIHFSSHFPALVFNSQSFHSISVNVGQATRFFPFPNLSYTLTSRRKSNQRLTPINPYQISVFINSMNPLTYDQIPQFLVATQKQW